MKITDEMLFAHAAEARDIWLSSLPTDDTIPDIHPSKKFEKKISRLIKAQRRTTKARKRRRAINKLVAATVILALLSFGCLMTAEAYREKVIEIVVHVFQELTEYRFTSERSGTDEIVLPELTLTNVPEGMLEVENRITGNHRRIITYESDTGLFFELTQQPISSDGVYHSILDTEDSVYEEIVIHGNTAYTNEKGDDCSVMWVIDNVIYKLYGNIDLHELIAIAEKIEIS